MIPARRNRLYSSWFNRYMNYRLGKAFNKLVVMPFEPKPGHSILLLCNHLSWWDGLWANYLAYQHLSRALFIMINEHDLGKRKWLTRFGGFSIDRKSRDMLRSLQYTAGLLDDPANLVALYPQGQLESNHAIGINLEKGTEWLLKNIKGPCQVIYSCALIDYFESLKPSVYFHLYDCGAVGEVTFEELKQRVNTFHQQALTAQVDMKH